MDVLVNLLRYTVNLADSKKGGKSVILSAIDGGHEKVLEKLLDANASLSCPNLLPSDQVLLHQANRRSNETMVSMLLDDGASVETCDELRRTALFETLDCHIDVAVLLLDHGISMSSQDQNRNTVLHEVAKRGAVKHASLFIDKGIELNAISEEGFTLLHPAVRHNHCRIVKDLLEKGAGLDCIDGQAGWTPLMYAASNGSTQLCHILLSYGADVAQVSADDKTSLAIAANAGHYQIAQILLDHGPDSDGLGTGLSLPLMLAAAAGHAQVVRLLLDHGADVNALDKGSNSALKLAANAGHASIVRLLLEVWGKSPYVEMGSRILGWEDNRD